MAIILWLSIVLAVGTYISGSVSDPDLWWHIVVGRWIVSHSDFPTIDYWNRFGAGEPWRAYSWSNEILFSFVDNHFGANGLLALQFIFSIFLTICLFCVFSKISKDWFFGSLIGTVATVGCFNNFSLRPQVLVWGYFAWILFWGTRIAKEGPTKRNLLWVFFLMVLWANTHVTSALGIVALFASVLSSRGWRDGLLVVSVAFLGTLVTPYFGGEWFSLLSQTNHPFAYQGIAEFRAATIWDYSAGFLALLFVVLGAFLIKKPKALSAPEILVGLIFIVGSLAVVKFIPFSVIYLSFLIAKIWNEGNAHEGELGDLGLAFTKLKNLFQKIPREGFAWLCICFAIINVWKFWSTPIDTRLVPVTAVDFIQKKKLETPIMNDFGRGGYLIYRFSNAVGELPNEYLVAIDGRTNVVPYDVFSKFLAAFRGKENWREYLELVKPKTILWPADNPFIALLKAGGAWCEVFREGKGSLAHVVFVARAGFDARKNELTSPNCR